jgi:SAM-dependent methyltransferase
MSEPSNELDRRRGDYGFDAPYVPTVMFAVGLVLVAIAIVNAVIGASFWGVLAPLLGGLFFVLSAACYVYATRVGKFVIWSRLLRELRLEGDETLLDMGCGRGAVLLAAARRLPRGRAVGVDLWRTVDQSGNRMELTLENADREGVRDRVELHTADMRSLPLADGTFDVVVTSMAIHNIRDREGRRQAIGEAARVLKPGGRLVVVDIRGLDDYAAQLRQDDMEAITRRGLGWRMWYGGPWVAASAITARRHPETHGGPVRSS